jgi:hypothetical protein
MIPYILSLFAGVGLWTAIGVTLVAGLMRGFAGFGSAMLMAPIFAILFGAAEMVVTIVAIELIVSLQLFPQVRRHADWKTLTPMSIAACAAMPLGVWALASVDKGIVVSVLCPQAVDTNMLRMAGATAASVDGVINTDAVAQTVIEAMDAETFLILPHPEVKEYMARKLDRDRWLRGMRRLRDKTGEGQGRRA